MRARTTIAVFAAMALSSAACASAAVEDTGSATTQSEPNVPDPTVEDPPGDETGTGPRPTVGAMSTSTTTDQPEAISATTAPTATSTVVPVTGIASPTPSDSTQIDGSLPGSNDPVSAPADSVTDEETVESGTEEPSFDLGPDVVLDVDVARFPPDDAGIGGAPVETVTGTTPNGSAPTDDADIGAARGWAGVDRYLESVLVRPGNTAASVAVSIDGEVVHRAAFGVRDPGTGDPAEPQDRFRIASISKPITAITVLSMVEDGVIGLDDPIGDLTARHVGMDSAVGASRGLTLRQLLTHRSGFGKYQGTFFGGGAADCIDATRTGLRSGSGGGGYRYSNMNYCIAGQAIEAITGLTYEQAVYRHLLTPLGISGMRLAPTFDAGPDEVQHVSTSGRNYMETLGAAGAWIATPSDLVTILDSLDADSGGFKPLSGETVLQMLTPPGRTIGQRGYGLGVISYGANRYGHTGTIESTHAMLLDRGDGVIWSITVAGQYPGESTSLERIMNDAFAAGGFVAG